MAFKRSDISQRSQIILMRKTGKTVTEISKELRLQRSTVYRWLERWENEGNLQDKLTAENYKKGCISQRSQIILLRKSGKSITEISNELNVQRSTVYRWVKRWETSQNLQDKLRGRAKETLTKKELPHDFVHRSWTPEETSTLLSLVAQYYNVINVKHSKKVEDYWQMISAQLSSQFAPISWRQAWYRWKTLKMKFEIYEKVRMTSCEEQQMPEYYAELSSIIGGPSIEFENSTIVLSEDCSEVNIPSMTTQADLDQFFGDVGEVNTHTEWQLSEVSKLLELIRLYFGAYANQPKRIKDAVMFKKITEQLCAATGKSVTSKQVCQKWRNLQRSYYGFEKSQEHPDRGRKRKSDCHEEIGKTLSFLDMQKKTSSNHSTMASTTTSANVDSVTMSVSPVITNFSPKIEYLPVQLESPDWTNEEIVKLLETLNENCDIMWHKEKLWSIVSEKFQLINPNIDAASCCKKWEELVSSVRCYKKLQKGENVQRPLHMDTIESILLRGGASFLKSPTDNSKIFKKILPKDPTLMLINLVMRKYSSLMDPRKAPLTWQEIYHEIIKMFPSITLDEMLRKWTSLKEDFVTHENLTNINDPQIIRAAMPYYEPVREILIENDATELPSASYCQPLSIGNWPQQDGACQKQSTAPVIVLTLNNANNPTTNSNNNNFEASASAASLSQPLVAPSIHEAISEATDLEISLPKPSTDSDVKTQESLNRLCTLVEDMRDQFLEQQKKQNNILEKLFELLTRSS